MKLGFGGGVFMPSTKLSKVRLKNMLANGSAVFIRHLKPNLDLGGGLAINNSFGFPMLFPAFYLNWTTNGRYDVKVSLNEGLEVSAGYEVNKNLNLSLVAEINGQMALLEQDGKDKIFTHQYIVAGLKPEIKLGKRVVIPIMVGINAMRPTQINDRSLKNIFSDRDYYFQLSPYGSVGFQMKF
jgi:hypothetical protein